LLRLVFGQRLAYLEQGWLLYLSTDEAGPPAALAVDPDAGDASPFMFAGPVDLVQLRSEVAALTWVRPGDVDQQIEARIRLVIDDGWRTWRILRRVVEVEGRPAAGRYVSLVADRFDERGQRVERIVGVRCKTEPFELTGSGVVGELIPFGGLWWWGQMRPPFAVGVTDTVTMTGVRVPCDRVEG
jgi:hypothetical protein